MGNQFAFDAASRKVFEGMRNRAGFASDEEFIVEAVLLMGKLAELKEKGFTELIVRNQKGEQRSLRGYKLPGRQLPADGQVALATR
jgi:hypothetical protein